MLTKQRTTISIKLYNNDVTVQSSNFRIKTRVLPFIQGLIRAEWTSGVIKVIYNKEQDYYNEATFKSAEELKILLTELTDPYLIDRFN